MSAPDPPAAASPSSEAPSSSGAGKEEMVTINDFNMVSKLGEGGFGTVMLVRKKSTGKLYALKLLEKSRMTKRGIADRVISESISLQQIRHPFVVTLHYAFQDKSRVYFVLEHVAGGDLFNFLQSLIAATSLILSSLVTSFNLAFLSYLF